LCLASTVPDTLILPVNCKSDMKRCSLISLHQTKANLIKAPSPFDEAWNEFVSVFTPREGYFITPLLLVINTAFFVVALVAARLFELDRHYIISLGANSRAATLNGEPWRLLSNVFLHWDIVHLFTNMLALYFIGSALEPYLKKGRFAVVYLLLGVLASVTSLWWHVKAVSAGASGAIFGLYGVFLALLTTNLLRARTAKSLLPGMILFIGYNLLGWTEGKHRQCRSYWWIHRWCHSRVFSVSVVEKQENKSGRDQ
jgi:rhomboid protease GluP